MCTGSKNETSLTDSLGQCSPSPWAGLKELEARNLEAQGHHKFCTSGVLPSRSRVTGVETIHVILAFLNSKCWDCTVSMVTEKPVSALKVGGGGVENTFSV